MLILSTAFALDLFLMLKIFVLVGAFFMSFVVNASGEAICPSTITCDYDSGVCDVMPPEWYLINGSAIEDFSNQTTIGLSKIMGISYKESGSMIECIYSYGQNSSIHIYTPAKELIGNNWVFSGFGKTKAECSDVTDPTTCYGIRYPNLN